MAMNSVEKAMMIGPPILGVMGSPYDAPKPQYGGYGQQQFGSYPSGPQMYSGYGQKSNFGSDVQRVWQQQPQQQQHQQPQQVSAYDSYFRVQQAGSPSIYSHYGSTWNANAVRSSIQTLAPDTQKRCPDGHHGGIKTELQMQWEGHLGEPAQWYPEDLQRSYQGERVMTKPEWHPVNRKPPVLLKEAPDNVDDMMKRMNDRKNNGTATAVEQILDAHRPFLGAIKQANIVDGVDGHVILDAPDPNELLYATRLHDYGRRRVAYATEVPVPERNSGVVINQESRPPKTKHLFEDTKRELELVCKADELIRNVHWNRIGPMIHIKDLEDEKAEQQKDLKMHADYKLAVDLGGLHGSGGHEETDDCRHQRQYQHFKKMFCKRTESVCADYPLMRHNEDNMLSEQMAKFVENTERVMGDELDAFRSDGTI